MSKSPLTQITIPADSSNYTKGRSSKITEITIHHMAGVLTAEQCGKIFQKKGRNGSSHYGIGNDGKIGNYVDESNTAWTNSNWPSNCRAVTIETSNCEIGGNWPVSDKALKSLIKLVADIAKRNNLGKLIPKKNLTYHRMYANTTCPGNYLISKLQYIADEANKINNTPSKQIEYRTGSGHWYATVTSGGQAGNGSSWDDRFQIRGIGFTIPYRAHILNGSWCSEVRKWDNTDDGYAGIYGKTMDGLAIGNVKRYRVMIYNPKTKKKYYLPWVTGYNIKDANNGYAGMLGCPIVKIQVEI